MSPEWGLGDGRTERGRLTDGLDTPNPADNTGDGLAVKKWIVASQV
jgi:hypothetical protein